MSLIDLLDKEEIWQEFLEHKINSSHLPKKIIADYVDFINNKKYLTIAKQIINGDYNFSIPKKKLISKMGKSKKRIVYLYNKEETYILKLISYLLYKYDYLFADNLYSFRQNSGVKLAIYNITKNKNISNMYGYKADIENYFNSISVDKLLPRLINDLDDLKLYNLIESILNNNLVDYNGTLIEEKKGIMAGVPISAFLANYYLKDLDDYFIKNNILYARYADDIILFADKLSDVKKYQKYIKAFLNKYNLKINNNKEDFYNPQDEFEFLGFSYHNGIIDLSKNTIKKIKGKIKRTARGLRRWKLKKNATYECTLKAMNRKFNNKFYGKEETDLTWKYWFFPTINTDCSLKIVDEYMQDWQRYVVTGVHNKKNYEKAPYDFLKKCNYKPLVHEFYNTKKHKD